MTIAVVPGQTAGAVPMRCFRLFSAQEIVTPLSTGRIWTVTMRDASDARESAALAMSSGWMRPSRCDCASLSSAGLLAISFFQIPPDLVVKFQTVDIVEVIELSWSDEAHPKIV